MADHLESDVVELRTSYNYLMNVVEKTSVQVDSIQHQTNKIPLLIQRHDDFLLQMGELKANHVSLSKDHSELKAEFKSWLNRGIGGWAVFAAICTVIYFVVVGKIQDAKDDWRKLEGTIQAANISNSANENQIQEAFRRIKNIEEKAKK